MAIEDADIIEGEVLEDTAAKPAAEKSGHSKEPARRTSNRLVWLLCGLLAAFIAGAISFPYMREALVQIGLAPASPIQNINQAVPDYSGALEDINKTLARHQEVLAQQAAQLADRATSEPSVMAASGETAALQAEVNAVKQQLAAQQTRMAETVASIEAASTGDSHLQAGQVAALQTEIAGLKAALAENQRQQTTLITAYTERLKGLEGGSIALSPRGRLYLALVDMRDRATAGEYVADDLSHIIQDERFLGQEDALARLEALRDWYVAMPDKTMDKAALEELLTAAVREYVSARQKENGSFLQNLFTVRRTGTAATGDDALLNTAEESMAAGNIKAALRAISGLEAQKGPMLQNWIRAAEQYLEVEKRFDDVIADARGAAQ
ncbi:hypothetical protein [Kordiimonas pumila]|uniref:Uncharacterized protein n=1 Tax=Kordiimonas pumila TaxID=2161677 RepID=A0ABV7D4W2_9PROT|nr:hypothetical protein [Kordiimonas pumila]